MIVYYIVLHFSVEDWIFAEVWNTNITTKVLGVCEIVIVTLIQQILNPSNLREYIGY